MPGKLGFVYFIDVQFFMCANNKIHFRSMVVFVCLHFTLPHYHNYANVSECIDLLNICQIYSVVCVSKIKSILSIMIHAIYENVHI